MRSMASLKSACVTASAPRRVASSAASLTRLARSAPEKPGVIAAIFSRSTSAPSFTFFACTCEDLQAALLVRAVDQHLAVEAPGAQQRRVEDLGPVGGGEQHQAGARVEAVELDQQLVERLLLLVVAAEAAGAARAAERVELVDEDDAGAFCRACSNRSRTRAAPTPTNISTNSEPEIEKNGTPASPATARASSVLPVPGGPTSSTPFGMRAPSRP